MNKILIKIYCIALVLMLSMTAFQFFSSADRPDNPNALSRLQAAQIADNRVATWETTPGIHLIAGICALLLVAYLYWSCYRKFKKDNLAELKVRKNTLYNISLKTGRTEYDLFHKSAEGWSVSNDKIEQDFKHYMSEQVMPHYAQDFVRKNREHIDESLITRKEVTPTTWKDWAIAVLVFPGSVLLLYFLMSLFDKYPKV